MKEQVFDKDGELVEEIVHEPDLDAAKAELRLAIKRWAFNALAATDWYVVRASEPGGIPIPPAILSARQAVRSAAQAADVAIEKASTLDALYAIAWTPKTEADALSTLADSEKEKKPPTTK